VLTGFGTGAMEKQQMTQTGSQKLYVKTIFSYQKDNQSDLWVMGQKSSKYSFGKVVVKE
jgi:hypothetical protein